MQIGSGWTTKEKDGISFVLDEAITEVFPQMKEIRFVAKLIPKEQRKTDKSPNWRLLAFKAEENVTTSSSAKETDENQEMPF